MGSSPTDARAGGCGAAWGAGWGRAVHGEPQPSAAPGNSGSTSCEQSGTVQLRAGVVAVPVWCRCHRGPVTGLAASPDGSLLFSSCSLGTLAQYHCASTPCRVLRVAGQTPVLPIQPPDHLLIWSPWGGGCSLPAAPG